MPIRALSTLLLLGGLAPHPAPAQRVAGEETASPRQAFVEAVDVNVVNVDVFVTDGQGNRVRDLVREDFELRVDGEPREITNFYVIDGEGPARAIGESLSAEPEPEPPGETEAGAAPDRRLHLVIYVDNFNLHPLTRDRALAQVRSFVRRRLGRDDLAMVVSYDGSLEIRQPFSSDRQRIVDALLELEEATGFAVATDRQRREVLRLIYDADELVAVSGLVTQQAEALFFDVQRSIAALKELVDSMAGLPGRKAILYLSDGLPMRAGEDLFAALDDRFEDSGNSLRALNYDASRDFRALTRSATANRIVFYSVDSQGLRPHSNADVENYHASRSSFVESTHEANMQDPLHYLANETGGQVIVNTNNLAPLLERVGDDFGSYYSLGFVSSGGGSGRYFEIEVRVKTRRGLEVRHRPGFRDKPVETQMAEGTMATLRFGVGNNPLGVAVELGEPAPRGHDSFLVPMVIKVPMGKLVFLPDQTRYRASVRLYLSAADAEGEVSNVDQLQVPIDLPEELYDEAQRHAYQYRHTLLVREGTRAVALGVRDEIGGGRSFLLLRPGV